MVLISASILSKSGKALVTRVFVSDMTRARMEGLLDAFPKLIGNDKDSAQRQHTFIETDSVRYVYHPLDNLYMVLITTKTSNILEDLETLRLFSRVIPEYCRSNDEKEILAHDFDLIFAFDEVVTLGYRESVNLAQIRTFTDMDSHEERVFLQIKEAQERAAKQAMAEKAKEFKRMQKEALSKGLKPSAANFSSVSGISSSSTPLTAVQESFTSKPSNTSSRIGGGKALKLGAKTDEDLFLQQLRQEGQSIASAEKSPRDASGVAMASSQISSVKREIVHVRVEEKMTATVSRDGGLQGAEILGVVSLSVAASEFNTVAIQMHNKAPGGAQLQVHPNLDKKDWQTSAMLKLKSANKPFPVNNDVGVLKWKMVLIEEEQLPIALNCWPQESPDGCQVNIEYTLQREDLSLENVTITIPLPVATIPVVSECEGSYDYQKARNQLIWTMPLIDSANSSGTLEFSVPNGHADHFFPVQIRFHSHNLYCDIGVDSVQLMDGSSAVPYSTETRFTTDKYEIV
ncbi:adaptor complexe medium subunit family protein [Dictyocaulus viviparus]|uniref:Coatomer subunit delta n=1 Tax=Dictyocaulus viviparus TaxID=29172 RepID=A0A0D8XDK6_DICVI|nr:adaptor complexe medium subunit family protein [Dictyocaulus viviparus]